MEFNFQISQRNEKKLPVDPVFINWVNFIKNVLFINCSRNLKSFKTIYFFVETPKERFKKKTRFFCLLAFIDSYNCLLAMFVDCV